MGVSVAILVFIVSLLLVSGIGYFNNMADIGGLITTIMFVGTIVVGILAMLNML